VVLNLFLTFPNRKVKSGRKIEEEELG